MSKFEAMRKFNDEHVDTPDGAFFQMAEDMHGWTADDWVYFSQECIKRKTYEPVEPRQAG